MRSPTRRQSTQVSRETRKHRPEARMPETWRSHTAPHRRQKRFPACAPDLAPRPRKALPSARASAACAVWPGKGCSPFASPALVGSYAERQQHTIHPYFPFIGQRGALRVHRINTYLQCFTAIAFRSHCAHVRAISDQTPPVGPKQALRLCDGGEFATAARTMKHIAHKGQRA